MAEVKEEVKKTGFFGSKEVKEEQVAPEVKPEVTTEAKKEEKVLDRQQANAKLASDNGYITSAMLKTRRS